MTWFVSPRDLYHWCKIPYTELENHPARKIPFRLVKDSVEMGDIMARELAGLIQKNNRLKRITRAIIPCGPVCWYKPFTEIVNRERISLRNLVVLGDPLHALI